LLREAIEPNKRLEKLYSNFSCKGHRHIIEWDHTDDTLKFDFAIRGDQFRLYRVFLDAPDEKAIPVGELLRPEGFVHTNLKPGTSSPEIASFGVRDQFRDYLTFHRSPYSVQWRPLHLWLTEEAKELSFIDRSKAVDLIVHPADPVKGVIVTLKMEYPANEKGHGERSIDLLKDHSWAILRSEYAEITKEGAVTWRNRVDVEYDFSKGWLLRMVRTTETMVEPGDVDKVRVLYDYHIEEIDFTTPDLKTFGPESLGLSIPTPATAKTSVWPWRLGMIGGGIVLIVLALYLRRRMRD
jgi:hypothetical protein